MCYNSAMVKSQKGKNHSSSSKPKTTKTVVVEVVEVKENLALKEKPTKEQNSDKKSAEKSEKAAEKKTDSRQQTEQSIDYTQEKLAATKLTAEDAASKRSGFWRRKRVKREPKRGKHPMPAILRIPLAITFLMLISIVFTWFVIWRTNMCDAGAAWEFIQEKTVLAFYNYTVIFCLLSVLAAITWRPFLSAGIFFSAISVITYIHIQKFQLRAEPLLPEEFALADSAGEIIDFVDINTIIRLVWGVILVLVGSALAEFFIRRFVGRDGKKLPWWDRTALVSRVTFIMVSLALLGAVVKPILKREHYEWLDGLDLIAWNQANNYDKNGFLIGFLYNLGKTPMEPPAEYSQVEMEEIAKKYRAIKAADTGRKEWSEVVDNVVVILAETTYDPALLTKYYDHYGGDVLPNLHKIFRDYPSGYMYSPEYGGGTANVEFEVQTGLSNYWAQTFPYVNLVSKMDSLYGVANFGKSFGFDTTAIHSYNGAVYKRDIVYPKIGYDVFIDESTMTHTQREYESGVINDQAVYQEILDLLKDSDTPQVIGVATMQNHAAYDQARYPKIEFPLKLNWSNKWAIEPSFQSLHEADAYLGEFIDELDKLDERTVVLWYGDHAMGMLDEYTNSSDKSERDIAHLTPYFVYANFDIESPYTTQAVATMNTKQGIDTDGVRGVDLPTTSPNCLQNTMYDILNIEKPAFFYLLSEVCEEVPILTQAYLAGENIIKSTALREYELVNYDLLYGKHYWDGD